MAAITGALIIPSGVAMADLMKEKIVQTGQDDARIIRTYGYDEDNNGFIEKDEMVSYMYRLTDENNDGVITDDEFQTSYAMTYYADQNNMDSADVETTDTKMTMSYWDKDKDDTLDTSEMETLVSDAGIYKQWDYDADGRVSVDELARGTFRAYDDNNDGMISKSEWKDVIR